MRELKVVKVKNTKLEKKVKELEALILKIQTNLDEHLLEHMIEERNKEFDMGYPKEDLLS